MSDELRAQRKALADFGSFAFRCQDLDALLTRAAELVSTALDIKLVKVLEHRPEHHDFLLRAGVNWAPGVVGNATMADHTQSPAGHALLTGEPVVSRDIAQETRFSIPHLLLRHGVRSMVNVIIVGEDEPFGVLEVDAQEQNDFDEDEIDFLHTYANLLALAVERIRRQEEVNKRAREQSVLARELSHRVRNVLGLVQALASQTAVEGRSAEEYRDAFKGRLQALSKAEVLVFDDDSDAADPQQIAEVILAPHRGARSEKIVISGPAVRLPARKGRMLGLALHELATNAAKYGALAASGGSVELKWAVNEDADPPLFLLTWEERGGPKVAQPDQNGFGTMLLEGVVGSEMEGESEIEYHPEGVIYRLSAPLG
ncbi:HWE histidine kinase domain-containing protein [Roseovarius sp. D0-M9]|uniref:HWE histidine kinase domain-containing protein n=1 Tax=Roseovarius sp. D0-M9 TaxID=3127117 RepID=UPI00300FCBDD